MASAFAADLWASVFTPGPTPALLRAANASFAALQLVLLALLAATASLHFVVLSALCAALWWAVNWFVAELARVAADDADDGGAPAAAAAADDAADRHDGSDTEVEGVASGSADTAAGRLRLRTAAVAAAPASPVGTQSSASTEDEWEKVSGGERDRGP